MSEREQQILCGTMTILLFVLMALEVLSPEVLFLIAIIILMLTQILTLTETLSGKQIFWKSYIFILTKKFKLII